MCIYLVYYDVVRFAPKNKSEFFQLRHLVPTAPNPQSIDNMVKVMKCACMKKMECFFLQIFFLFLLLAVHCISLMSQAASKCSSYCVEYEPIRKVLFCFPIPLLCFDGILKMLDLRPRPNSHGPLTDP